jgi:hypothetical protein
MHMGVASKLTSNLLGLNKALLIKGKRYAQAITTI